MKSNESSITSLISAFARAYHSEYDDSPKVFDDRLARQLITPSEFLMIKSNMVQGISFLMKSLLERIKSSLMSYCAGLPKCSFLLRH